MGDGTSADQDRRAAAAVAMPGHQGSGPSSASGRITRTRNPWRWRMPGDREVRIGPLALSGPARRESDRLAERAIGAGHSAIPRVRGSSQSGDYLIAERRKPSCQATAESKNERQFNIVWMLVRDSGGKCCIRGWMSTMKGFPKKRTLVATVLHRSCLNLDPNLAKRCWSGGNWRSGQSAEDSAISRLLSGVVFLET